MYPEQASNFAPNVDALMVYITAICVFFAVAITAAIVLFFFLCTANGQAISVP